MTQELYEIADALLPGVPLGEGDADFAEYVGERSTGLRRYAYLHSGPTRAISSWRGPVVAAAD